MSASPPSSISPTGGSNQLARDALRPCVSRAPLFIPIVTWLQFLSAGRTSCQQSPLFSTRPCLLSHAQSCVGSSSTSPPRSLFYPWLLRLLLFSSFVARPATSLCFT